MPQGYLKSRNFYIKFLFDSRNSGKILHIDFGDCFEVAMTREKFPEKIPFRLTRYCTLNT